MKNKEQLKCCADSQDASGQTSSSVLYKDIIAYDYLSCALEVRSWMQYV